MDMRKNEEIRYRRSTLVFPCFSVVVQTAIVFCCCFVVLFYIQYKDCRLETGR